MNITVDPFPHTYSDANYFEELGKVSTHFHYWSLTNNTLHESSGVASIIFQGRNISLTSYCKCQKGSRHDLRCFQVRNGEIGPFCRKVVNKYQVSFLNKMFFIDNNVNTFRCKKSYQSCVLAWPVILFVSIIIHLFSHQDHRGHVFLGLEDFSLTNIQFAACTASTYTSTTDYT